MVAHLHNTRIFSTLYTARNLICMFTRARPVNSILSQLNLALIFALYSCKVNYNMALLLLELMELYLYSPYMPSWRGQGKPNFFFLLQPTPRFPKGSIVFGFYSFIVSIFFFQ